MTEQKPKRSIKQVTLAASGGGVLGGAIADVLVHVFPSLDGVEEPLGIILTALLGLLGGYLVPPQKEETIDEVVYELEMGDNAPDAQELADEVASRSRRNRRGPDTRHAPGIMNAGEASPVYDEVSRSTGRRAKAE